MKIIDLTLTISNKIPTFPGSPQPNFIPWEKIKDDGYNLELLFLSSHTGTHLDAPYHFLEKGAKIHEISLKKLVSNAVLIKSRKKSNESVTKTDIQKFEKKHGKIASFSSVIFYTGWQRNLQKKYYFTKNPGLSVSAAKYLASKKISLVGIDSPSIDLGTDSKFSVHQIFAKKGMRDKVDITFVTPLPGAFTKPVATKMLSELLAEKNINIVPDFYCEKIDNDNKALQIPVKVGNGKDKLVEVTPTSNITLNAGDKVAVRGAEQLQTGQEVEVQVKQ